MQKLILHVIEPLLSLLEQMGLKEPLTRWAQRSWLWMAGVAMTALYIAWNFYLYLWGLIPLWAVPAFVLANVSLFICVCLGLTWFGLRVAAMWSDWRRRTADKARITEWANKIEQDCVTMADYYNSLADANDVYKPREGGPEVWDMDNNAKRKTAAKFYARYAGRILANNHLIESLGIELPWHFKHSVADQPNSLIAYHSYIATLLKDGHLEKARSIGDREGFDLIDSICRW